MPILDLLVANTEPTNGFQALLNHDSTIRVTQGTEMCVPLSLT